MTVTQKIPPLISVLIGAVLIGILMVLIKWGAPVLTPILVAGFLAALAAPLYFWLQKRGVSSTLSLVLMIVLMIVAVVALAGLLYLSATRMLDGLVGYEDQLVGYEDEAVQILATLGVTEQTLGDAITGDFLVKIVVAILGGVVSFAGDLLFGLVLVSFLLIDFKRLINLATSELHGRPFFGQLPAIAKTASAYFGVRTRLNLVTGIGVGLFLLVLGVDYAFLWGAMAFVLSYIPYVGLFTAMVPPTILALAEHGIGMAIVVVIGAIVINLLIENIVEPRLTSKTLHLSAVVVLVAFFFWGWMLGATGAMLSMPIMVTIMLVTEADPRTNWLAKIIGTDESGEIDGSDSSGDGETDGAEEETEE